MRKAALILVAAVLGAAPLAAQQPTAPARPQQPAMSPEQQEVRNAARAFKDALTRGDSVAALGYLTDDVLILEGGRAETKTQYRSGHLAADIRFATSVKSETVREGVTLHGEVALYTQSYRVTGTSARGDPIDRTSSEAMTLVRTPAGWRIRGLHWF
jgi:ketosteroid isomerase-like protein